MKLKIGDKAKVTNPKCLTCGCIVCVLSTNPKGCWTSLPSGKTMYYNFTSLTKVKDYEEENTTMIITGNFKVARVKFLSGTNTNIEYEYAMFDDYSVGDVVVVASAHHGLGLAKITAIISREEAVTKKFEREIVSVVYMDAYEERKKNRAKLADLTNRMNQRVQELNKLAIFEMMAEKDESLKAMLDEYKGLIG